MNIYRCIPWASLLALVATACGPAGNNGDRCFTGHSLSAGGTGPLPQKEARGVLITGWRGEEHGPWLLRRLMVDGQLTGLWPADNQVPGAIELAPGHHEVIVEVTFGEQRARTAARRVEFRAGSIVVCPVDVNPDDDMPELRCGEHVEGQIVPPSKTGVTPWRGPSSTPSSAGNGAAASSRTSSRRQRGARRNRRQDDAEPAQTERTRSSGPTTPRPPPPPERGRAKLGRIQQLPGGGKLAETSIMARFRKHKNAIMECYDAEIKQKNYARGKILLEFVVWNDGCAAEVKTKIQSQGLAPTAQCISTILKGFCFDAPLGGPAKFRLPVLFQPVTPKASSGKRRKNRRRRR